MLPADPSVTLGLPDRGMLRHSTLSALLQGHALVIGSGNCRRLPIHALLAWGHKPSGRVAERIAAERSLPVWRCEDAFLRSMGLGATEPPLGLLLDDEGMYYDASSKSRLESLIGACRGPAEYNRAEAIRSLWCQSRVSKYNAARESEPPDQPYVLVVDQSYGDLSIRYGQADRASFQRMLHEALANHPDHLVVLKIHPDVVARRRRGHYSAAELSHPRLRICMDGGHPVALLERAEAVYVVTSQLGFEALLWGRPVHCYGMPFYAGWGLTHDHLQAPLRRAAIPTRRLADLVHAAFVDYATYVDPHAHQCCSVEELISCIALQRRLRQRFPSPIDAYGFAPWKRPVLRRFLAGTRVRFRLPFRSPSRHAAAVAVWGCRPSLAVQRWEQREELRTAARPLLRVEDGFLRSVGLGADLINPLSWVIDQTGIYYDATGPSDLELLLSGGSWSEEECRRAERLRLRLVKHAVTKYNLKATPWCRPASAGRVILVPGQVESDASIRLGAPGLSRNMALLQAVRHAEPQAYLIYKPHPDVVAGLCRSGVGERDAALWCDEVVVDSSIDQLFHEVDALHVLTSNAGFEALLRQLPVHTWGLPFYAGWGLTHDHLHSCRRGRPLRLEELVHAVLIEYPTYISRRSGLFLEPEQALDELLEWRAAPRQALGLRQRIFRHWGRLRRR